MDPGCKPRNSAASILHTSSVFTRTYSLHECLGVFSFMRIVLYESILPKVCNQVAGNRWEAVSICFQEIKAMSISVESGKPPATYPALVFNLGKL